MKIILASFMLCSIANAFTLMPQAPMPRTFYYQCDPELEVSFINAIELWNSALDDPFIPLPLPDNSSEPYVLVNFGPIGPALGVGAPMHVVISDSFDYQKYSIDRVMVHECGHLLGLNHSTVGGSIMIATMLPEDMQSTLTLGEDDIIGIRSIYDRDISINVTLSQRKNSRSAQFNTLGVPMHFDFGDGTMIDSESPWHKFAARGIYTVTVTYFGLSEQFTIVAGRPIKKRRVK